MGIRNALEHEMNQKLSKKEYEYLRHKIGRGLGRIGKIQRLVRDSHSDPSVGLLPEEAVMYNGLNVELAELYDRLYATSGLQPSTAYRLYNEMTRLQDLEKQLAPLWT